MDKQEQRGRDRHQRHQFARPASTVQVLLLLVHGRSRIRISARSWLLIVHCVGRIINSVKSLAWPTWLVDR